MIQCRGAQNQSTSPDPGFRLKTRPELRPSVSSHWLRHAASVVSKDAASLCRDAMDGVVTYSAWECAEVKRSCASPVVVYMDLRTNQQCGVNDRPPPFQKTPLLWAPSVVPPSSLKTAGGPCVSLPAVCFGRTHASCSLWPHTVCGLKPPPSCSSHVSGSPLHLAVYVSPGPGPPCSRTVIVVMNTLSVFMSRSPSRPVPRAQQANHGRGGSRGQGSVPPPLRSNKSFHFPGHGSKGLHP